MNFYANIFKSPTSQTSMVNEVSALEKTVIKLDKRVADQPIELPSSPFWDVFKKFGRDEAIAMIINVTGTAGLEYFLSTPFASTLSAGTKEMALTVAGPVVEKAGFFPGHLKEAWDAYRAAPADKRDPLSTYFKKAVKGGSKSLLQDIIVHDPVYMGLMYAGLKFHPETPAWIIATTSFVAAVFAVAGLEIGANELLYKRYKGALQKAGFGTESYLESRFLIDAEKQPEEVIENIVGRFNLSKVKIGQYHDRYFGNTLPHYNNRSPLLRLRRRVIEDEGREVKSAQIVYTRASEIVGKEPEQFRYFPQQKDKLYFLLDQRMPENIDEIDDERVRRILKRAQREEDYIDVHFERTVASSPSTLLVSADQVQQASPFYVLELKTFKDKRLLREAMHYVMKEFPVLQTTYRKLDLVGLQGA